MQAPETAGVEAPAASPSSDDVVVALLTEMSQRLIGMDERLTALESRPETPAFIDPQVHANTKAADRSRAALASEPDGIPKGQTIPIFPNGQRVPDLVMGMFRPKFGTGDVVQLDLDAVPEGRDDGRTRGELMAEKGVPNGYGQVLDRTFLSEQMGKGWKYRVKFDKKVMPGSNGGIVHLYERELLPA